MLIDILRGAPTWVWGLLVALLALGASQSVPRSLSLRRATAVPAILVMLSFYGVASTFGAHGLALAGWVAGLASVVLLALATNAWSGATWLEQERRVRVPGSWWPMLLIVALFTIKFGVGATLALHPERRADPMFEAFVGLAYGAFSGLFASRGLALWKVARRQALPLVQRLQA
ncbi:MAG TPA: DUF6622 family protein [Albitalea sp.]|nr:DUF6622 family protein [Albitalea sp.]